MNHKTYYVQKEWSSSLMENIISHEIMKKKKEFQKIEDGEGQGKKKKTKKRETKSGLR